MHAQHKDLGRQVHLPFKRAFAISLQNIRLRLGRSVVTASGIMLGIAFLDSVLTQRAVNQAIGAAVTQDARMREIWLVALALLMSTLGITNSMLMAVTERYKEIGTLKCLGALDRFVVEMFVLEGMLMGFFASASGAIMGGGLTLLAAGFTQGWHAIGAVGFGPLGWIFFESVVGGSFLTFLATIAPAVRAAKMPPAAALRAEI